eukprot:2528175-Amphidinium_carterae.1
MSLSNSESICLFGALLTHEGPGCQGCTNRLHKFCTVQQGQGPLHSLSTLCNKAHSLMPCGGDAHMSRKEKPRNR